MTSSLRTYGRSLAWSISCMICLATLAEIALENQGAKPLRTAPIAKLETKPEDYL